MKKDTAMSDGEVIRLVWENRSVLPGLLGIMSCIDFSRGDYLFVESEILSCHMQWQVFFDWFETWWFPDKNVMEPASWQTQTHPEVQPLVMAPLCKTQQFW